MNSIVLTTANAKTDKNHVLRLNLMTDLKLEDNFISLSHCSIYYNWKNFKQEYNNTDFSYTDLATSTSYNITIPDGSYSIIDLNNFIHHHMLINGHVNSDDTYDINIYPNPVYNRVTITVSNKFSFNMSSGLMDTLGFEASQNNITNMEVNGNLVPNLERVNSVLIHCNLVDNRITHNSSILYSFVPEESFGRLLSIKPNYSQNRFCRNGSFNFIEIYFTDQDENPLDVEDKISIEIQIINKSIYNY